MTDMGEEWAGLDPALKAEAQAALDAGVTDQLVGEMRQLAADCLALADAIEKRDLEAAAMAGAAVTTAMLQHTVALGQAAVLVQVRRIRHEHRRAGMN